MVERRNTERSTAHAKTSSKSSYFTSSIIRPSLAFASRVVTTDGSSFQLSYDSTQWLSQGDLSMMPQRTNLSDLPAVAKAPEARLASTHRTPLRTYSRRSLKRRHTSPPAQNVERFFRRSGSLNATEKKTAEQFSVAKIQQPSRSIPSKDRKRSGISLAFPENKTPSDLAWEALASSAPVLTREDDNSPGEGEPHETHVVECSPGYKWSEHQQPYVEDAQSGPTKGREGKSREESASEAATAGNRNLEESDDVEKGKE